MHHIVKSIGHNRYIMHGDEMLALTLPTRLRKEGIEAYVGDRVMVDLDRLVITDVLGRENLLTKPKVANVDQAMAVISVDQPAPDWEHLDRVLCMLSMATGSLPLLCLTKCDLSSQPEIEQKFALYAGLGYRVLRSSVLSDDGLAELVLHLCGRMSVMVGRSGVGKSSLLNAIAGCQLSRIGDLSRRRHTGMHTTRHIQMYVCGDIKLIDVPGFERLPVEYTRQQLIRARPFPEMHAECRYADCMHIGEDGCRVSMTSSRLHSYRSIMSEAQLYEDNLHKRNHIGYKYLSGGRRVPILAPKLRKRESE